MKLREVGEFGLIGRIAARAGGGESVLLGIGDDAAAVMPSPGCATLVTTDMLVEGIHFDLSFTGPRTLGRKSLAVNLSDIAAMGGIPRFFLLSLALPPTVPVEFVDECTAGMLEMAGQYGVHLVGGDTCSARNGIVISITLFGEQTPHSVVRRSGARPGNDIFVTGTVGDSALGLALLQSGARSGPAIERHLDPRPRVEAGRLLAEAGIPTAMIDISDGIVSDLGHILTASGTGATVFADRLPLSDFFRATASGENRLRFPLAGGEDYELLFTAPPERREDILHLLDSLALPVTPVGTISASPGLALTDTGGAPVTLPSGGYDHFAGIDNSRGIC